MVQQKKYIRGNNKYFMTIALYIMEREPFRNRNKFWKNPTVEN